MSRAVVRIPSGAVWAAATLFATVGALASGVFSSLTGVSLWSLRADSTATWPYILAMNLAYWFSWAPLVRPALALEARLPGTEGGWLRLLAAHCVVGATLVFAHAVLVASVRLLLQRAVGVSHPWSEGVLVQFLRTFDWEFASYAGLVGSTYAIRYYRDSSARALESAELQTQLVAAQLQALQRQLHPHFLFNTLHAISALVRHDPDRAEAMIERLGDLLRLTLNRGGLQEVALREELRYLDVYLAIERIHFAERLAVTRDIDPDTLDVRVPILILQPLVENAIRHGLSPRRAGGRIWIAARLDGSRLVLAVRDDGVGIREGAAADGVGLTNTRARLERLYGDDHVFSLRALREGGTRVEIHVPLREACSGTSPALLEVPA